MKLKWVILCLIIGHNKVLHVKKETGCIQYFTVCSQCQRSWKNNQLSEKSQSSFKSQNIKIRAHVKTVIVNRPEIRVSKKQTVNFYLL